MTGGPPLSENFKLSSLIKALNPLCVLLAHRVSNGHRLIIKVFSFRFVTVFTSLYFYALFFSSSEVRSSRLWASYDL